MTLRQLAERSREESPARRLVAASEAVLRRPVYRVRTRLPWFDFMTGGGIPRGAVYLIHGGPGSGKSTMLSQAAGSVAGAAYVSGEEDESQVAARFLRLGCDCDILAESSMAAALDAVSRAPLVVLDSLQALAPGGVAAAQLAVDHARRERVAILLVCQQNKEGQHAGLRAIEHLTDATIRLDRSPRAITTEKNRYGEAGISLFLKMTEKGLEVQL